jgi:asparagine synthase (glutamine-hydrolysing)
MSGICGIVSFGTSNPDRAALARMTAALKARGPDGTSHWHGERALLGHTLLATTPEAAIEKLPLTDECSGCTITADARLDNREDLITALDLSSTSRTVGDGELILQSYLKWGINCAEKLLGDFAFAINDPRNRTLFCARDHLGMRQLSYSRCESSKSIYFATDVKAVVSSGYMTFAVNEARVDDYLHGLESRSLSETFFQGVKRLPPAHYLVADATHVMTKRYWSPEPQPQLQLESNEAYAEAFRKVFEEAVRCRLRCNGRVGAMLSGGMDSSSVVAVAAELIQSAGAAELPTFSAVAPEPTNCKETYHVHLASTMPNLQPHFIKYSDPQLLSHLAKKFNMLDEPFDGNMSMLRGVYRTAQAAGIKVVLDGAAADIILGGVDPLAHLLRRGRFREAVYHARKVRLYWGPWWPQAGKSLLAAAWRAYIPRWLRRARRRLVGRAAPVPARVSPSHKKKSDEAVVSDADPRSPEGRAQAMVTPILPAGRERYDRVAASYGVEPRDPFLDLRLIKLCMALPPDQLEACGWPKLILRRAMAGRVPDKVRWRRGKEHLGWRFEEAVFQAAGAYNPDHLPLSEVADAMWLQLWLQTVDAQQIFSDKMERCIVNESAS